MPLHQTINHCSLFVIKPNLVDKDFQNSQTWQWSSACLMSLTTPCVYQGILFESKLNQGEHVIRSLVATIHMNILHETFYAFWLKNKGKFCFICALSVCFKFLRKKQKWKTTKHMFQPDPLDVLFFLGTDDSQLGILLFWEFLRPWVPLGYNIECPTNQILLSNSISDHG